MKNRYVLITLHRWFGFIVAPLVIVICITGILLNHTSELALGKKNMPHFFAKVFYDLETSPIPNIIVNNIKIQQQSNGNILVNNQPVGQCQNAMLGAVKSQQQIIIACAYKLIFISTGGLLLEEQGRSLGIPMPLVAINSFENEVLLTNVNSAWSINPDTLSVTRLEQEQYSTLLATQPSKTVFAPVYDLSLERLFLDLHSGRAWGKWGAWLTDAAAIILVLMIVSGYLAWKKRVKPSPTRS